MAFCAISYPTGAMTNRVAASAMPFNAMLGGTCCTPIALRVIISTMTIFRKAVQTINNIGINDNAARNNARRPAAAAPALTRWWTSQSHTLPLSSMNSSGRLRSFRRSLIRATKINPLPYILYLKSSGDILSRISAHLSREMLERFVSTVSSMCWRMLDASSTFLAT